MSHEHKKNGQQALCLLPVGGGWFVSIKMLYSLFVIGYNAFVFFQFFLCH